MSVEPAAVSPAGYASKEMATAAAAGTGAGVAGEISHASGAQEHGTVANTLDILGALAGSSTLAAKRIVGKPLSDVAQALFRRERFSNDTVKNEVVDRLVNNADTLPKTEGKPVDTQQLVDAITGGNRVDATIPGFKDSLADRTGDPGLAALEYGRQSGPGAGQITARRADNAAAVDSAMNKNAPDGHPADLRAALETERAKRLGTADTVAQDASAAATNAVADVTPRY